MSNLSRIFHYSKCYWKQLLVSVLAAVLCGLFSAAPSYVIQHAVDDIFVKGLAHLIIPFICCFIALFVCDGISTYFSAYYMNWVGHKVVNDIRKDLFDKIIFFPLSFFKKRTTGELMAHFLNDIKMIQNASSNAIKQGVRSIFEAFFLLTVAFIQNPKLALLIMLMGPIVIIAIRRMGKAIRATATTIQNEMGSVSSLLQEIFVGIREIKAFNAEQYECNRFSDHLKRCFSSFMHNVHAESLGPAFIETISMAGGSIIFYIAAQQVLSGTITPGQLTSFFAAVLLAFQPIKRLINTYADIQNGLAAADRIFALMDTPIEESSRNINLPCFTKSISIANLSFYHQPNLPILDSVSLTIGRGERIGFVGASGCGKSTLCDLLLGLIKPISGNLYIDGLDATKITLQSLRAQIGYVSQHPFLFNDTIYANITYAIPTPTAQELERACRQANIYEFITQMPLGFNTMVGENGTLLSGGQKQRITIARALLKKPAILILDEATSSLDAASEELICNAIDQLSNEITVLAVSHRPSLINKMDRIFTIKETKLIEVGKEYMLAVPTDNSLEDYSKRAWK